MNITHDFDNLQSDTYKEVISDLISREKMGRAKYGVTVDKANLSELEWMHHAYEEALDFAIYLKRLMQLKKQR
jgi:hypothetical protein